VKKFVAGGVALAITNGYSQGGIWVSSRR